MANERANQSMALTSATTQMVTVSVSRPTAIAQPICRPRGVWNAAQRMGGSMRRPTTMPSMSRYLALLDTPRVQFVLIAASVLGLIIGLDTLILHLTTDPLADVHAYYDAGARLNAGLPLYDQPAGTDDADFYRYPPLLAVAFRPLAMLPFQTAALIWEGLLLVLFAGTIWRTGVRNRWTWIVLGWLAAPFAWSLAVGQAQVAVTFLVALGSPWAIAFAAHLKILPALVAIYWLGRRDWRAFATFVAWGLGLLAVSFVLEPAGTIAFLGFPDLGQVGDVENRSLYAISPWLWAAFVGRLRGAGPALRPEPDRLAPGGRGVGLRQPAAAHVPALDTAGRGTAAGCGRRGGREGCRRGGHGRGRHADPPGQFGLRTMIAVPVLSPSGSWLSAGT